MTNIEILAQVVNAIGSTTNMVGISAKEKRRVLLFFTLGNFFVGLSLFLLKAYTGMFVQITFVTETIINYFWDKKGKQYPIWLILIYIIIPCTIILINYKEIWDLFPLAGAVFFPASLISKNFQLRLLNFFAIVVWIPYNIHFGQYAGTIFCTVYAIVNIISIIRHDIIKK